MIEFQENCRDYIQSMCKSNGNDIPVPVGDKIAMLGTGEQSRGSQNLIWALLWRKRRIIQRLENESEIRFVTLAKVDHSLRSVAIFF